jgi:hypothetical protein
MQKIKQFLNPNLTKFVIFFSALILSLLYYFGVENLKIVRDVLLGLSILLVPSYSAHCLYAGFRQGCEYLFPIDIIILYLWVCAFYEIFRFTFSKNVVPAGTNEIIQTNTSKQQTIKLLSAGNFIINAAVMSWYLSIEDGLAQYLSGGLVFMVLLFTLLLAIIQTVILYKYRPFKKNFLYFFVVTFFLANVVPVMLFPTFYDILRSDF